MFDKEAVIELIRSLPDDVTVEGVIAALTVQAAPKEAPDEPEWSAEELTEDEWRQVVAYGLRDELNDPRDDIYALEDGQPEDAPR